ncbi:hypothetical protein [Gulosibacter massiliensis]|uniref:hypothetical protein n=1 Tax=Gulosibacter massiliensis TaxID=2479839 RepID=UPI000F62EC7D|nr:hypothetical protein [Gulosibacter massiliensis]
MTEKLSDERLAELRAMQQKRIEGRGGVPEVRDLLKALDELTEHRTCTAQRARALQAEGKLNRIRDYLTTQEAERETYWPPDAWVLSGIVIAILDGSDT